MSDRSLATLVVAGVVLAFAVLHVPSISVPYFDDEVGYYVPRALAIHDAQGLLEKVQATMAPVYKTDPGHTPLLEIVLAMMWRAFGYSIVTTRIFGLAIASIALGVTAAIGFRLAGWKGATGSAVLLGASPLFFFHGYAAVPEALVTLFVSVFLLALLTGHRWAAVLSLTAAAATKETALALLPSAGLYYALVPNGVHERGWRSLVPLRPFLLPVAIVILWFAIRHALVGTAFGGSGLDQWYALVDRLRHPREIGVLAVVRTLQLAYFDYRWIGALAIAAALGLWFVRRRRLPGHTSVLRDSSVPWIVLGSVAVLLVLVHSMVGIAVLPRYLLPALPAFSVLSAGALLSLSSRYGLLASFLIGALYLASYRDGSYRLARFVMGAYNDHAEAQDIVEAYRSAFRFVEDTNPDAVVAANYPGTVMAQDPRLGYVRRVHEVRPLPETQAGFESAGDLYVVVSRFPAPYPGWIDGANDLCRKGFIVEEKSVTVLWGPEEGAGCRGGD